MTCRWVLPLVIQLTVMTYLSPHLSLPIMPLDDLAPFVGEQRKSIMLVVEYRRI